MKLHSFLARVLSPMVCVLLLTGFVQAQFRASLRGTVSDSQGAVIAGATVTLVNSDTNNKMVATSDGNGVYQFNGLAPAPYHLAGAVVRRRGR